MKPKIAVIIGSIRPVRNGDKIGQWFMNQVQSRDDMEFTLIDLADEKLPFLNEPKLPAAGDYEQASTQAWASKIATYDGFVFVVSEYNHGYSASLKNAIDTLYAEWAHKPVAFMAYGALGGVRAVEQLVQVTAQLNMVPIPSAQVNIININSALDDNGTPKDSHIRGDVNKLCDKLLWWAQVLQPARDQS